MELTTTQVSLVAAGIALAAPLITYRANVRLDRERWVRQQRAEGTGTAAGAPGDTEAGVRRTQADGHRTEVRELYADLISRVREELRQDREPRWRRLGAGRPGS